MSFFSLAADFNANLPKALVDLSDLFFPQQRHAIAHRKDGRFHAGIVFDKIVEGQDCKGLLIVSGDFAHYFASPEGVVGNDQTARGYLW